MVKDKDKEMELLLSEEEVKVGDKDVIVKRIPLLDTIRIASKLSDVVSRVINSSDEFNLALYKIMYSGRTDADGNEIEETENQRNAIRASGILELIGLAGDDAVDLLKMIIVKSTNLGTDDAETLDSLDGIELIETIYKVNKSFFKKCMSKLKEKMGTNEKQKKTKSK